MGDKHTTITSSAWQFEVWRGNELRALKYARNVLTDGGLREMALRSTGGTTSQNTHMAVGTGVRAEAASDVALQAEVGRRAMDSRTVDGSTERYTCAFNRVQLGSITRHISEAGIFTLSVGGILVHRVTTDPVTVGIPDTLTITTTVGHRNGAS